jgi:hypothetical protein
MTRNHSTALVGSVLAAALALIGLGGYTGARGPFLGQENVVNRDFNADGIVDILTTRADGGSGFGGDFVALKDGKTGRTFAYNTWGSYGQFLRIIPFEDDLMKPENSGFKAALEGALFSEIPRGDIDRSLAWLIDAYSHPVEEPEAEGNPLFSQKIRFEPRWTEGPPAPPTSYYIVTSDETLLRGYPIYQEDNPAADSAHRQAWLVYYGKNHATLEPKPAAGDVRVFLSAHGVAVSEGGRSCWVFVNDEVLTAGPAKLRWRSIKSVLLSDGLVFIHHTGAADHLFVVDFRNGVAGRLNPALFPPSGGEFDVREGRLFLRGGAESGPVDLDTIKTSLK